MLRFIRLYLALAGWAFWMGGFAFYFAVVVPTGGKVLGGSEQGFVTQHVTHWLNLIGMAALALMLWDAIARRSRLLLVSWTLLAILQVGLLVMHRQLDVLIDAPARAVTNDTRFHAWHEWYESVATIQFVVGLIYLGGATRSFITEAAKKQHW
jgi:hypothetical protein